MIKVKLFANLREGRKKEVDFEFFEGINGKYILKVLNIPEKQVSIFLVNGKDRSLDEALSDEDVVAIFPPVGGG
uniref:MoaD/ThiS family protein n=1 Tax=Thermodesulfobacterium geofontis TaxID=1295609 RepID=A0A7V4JR67_9BACT